MNIAHKIKDFILIKCLFVVILVLACIYVYENDTFTYFGWKGQEVWLSSREELEQKFPIGKNQHDPELISYLKEKVIVPPSDKPYLLDHPEKKDFSQLKQGEFLYNYFRNKKNGTFIEAGAFNGEKLSNTLILERELGWTGLLIEPNPFSYKDISLKNVKAHHAQCCLSLTPKSINMTLSVDELLSKIITDSKTPKRVTSVTCYPLYSLMVAANLTTLDLLSLDVESVEVKVLKTIPWDEVDIRAILVAVNHIPEGTEYITKYMEQKNYILYKEIVIDYFFVKNI